MQMNSSDISPLMSYGGESTLNELNISACKSKDSLFASDCKEKNKKRSSSTYRSGIGKSCDFEEIKN